MVNKILIEKYKGFEIFYDKDKEMFVANKSNICFESYRLWEIKGLIKQSRTVEVNKTAFIKDSCFEERVQKVKILNRNTITGEIEYKILASSNGYEVGRTNKEKVRTYPDNELNKRIFDEIFQLEKEKEELEARQKILAKQMGVK